MKQQKKQRSLNVIAPVDPGSFGALVADAFGQRGVDVHIWDYRKPLSDSTGLDRDAKTIVLRGDAIKKIAPVLRWLRTPAILWYAEDVMFDGCRELMQLACYYSEIWLHWKSPMSVEAIENNFQNKTLRQVPTLYADQSVWNPTMYDAESNQTKAHYTEVLHYGFMTQRREKILSALRQRQTHDKRTLAVMQARENDHAFLADLVARSMAVVNIHAYSGLNIETRIAEAMSCGALVVTEALPDDMLITNAMLNHEPKIIWQVESGDIAGMHSLLDSLTGSAHYDFLETARPAIVEFARNNFSHTLLPDAIGPYIWDDWSKAE